MGRLPNKLTVLKIQEDNIVTSQNNFDRTLEKFKLGQINSIEFRQAQLNLINAELSKNQAKYQAKIAELELLRLSGELLNYQSRVEDVKILSISSIKIVFHLFSSYFRTQISPKST